MSFVLVQSRRSAARVIFCDVAALAAAAAVSAATERSLPSVNSTRSAYDNVIIESECSGALNIRVFCLGLAQTWQDCATARPAKAAMPPPISRTRLAFATNGRPPVRHQYASSSSAGHMHTLPVLLKPIRSCQSKRREREEFAMTGAAIKM